MATFVTLAEAKDHLRITTPDDDPGDVALTQQLTFAEAHVIDWCSKTPRSKAVADAWTPETIPSVVRYAILLRCGEAYRFRGDDVAGAGPARVDGADLAPQIAELLRGYHDPVVA